ncbi:MAG: zinc ribbon domain-containing protein [Gemmatimonadota bacterium]
MALESPGSTLERFHRVLVSEISDRRPEYLERPFTVAEIYQHLVPYASHRDRLGLEMNGDYEDALLRLLAGEGDYLLLDSEPARDRLRSEVESGHPDTSLYREFAAVDVRLNPDRLPGESGEAVPMDALAPAEPEPAAGDGDTVTPAGDLAEPSPEQPTVVQPALEVEPEPPATGSDARTCSWCRETLPDRENLNFCPFCGTDVNVIPCPSCGEALEAHWRFCIACGAGVSEE